MVATHDLMINAPYSASISAQAEYRDSLRCNPSEPRGKCGASLLGRNAGACARDAGAGLGSEISPGFAVPKTCPPTHGRSARAQPTPLPPAQACQVGRAGPHPHTGSPSGQMQLGRAQIYAVSQDLGGGSMFKPFKPGSWEGLGSRYIPVRSHFQMVHF